MDLAETFLRRGTGFICYFTGISSLLHQYTLDKLIEWNEKKIRWLEYSGQTHSEDDILLVFGSLKLSAVDWKGITVGVQLNISNRESIDILSKFDYLLVSQLNQLRRLQMILGTWRVIWLPSLLFSERPVAGGRRSVLNFDKFPYSNISDLIDLVISSKIIISRNDLEDQVSAALTRPFISLHCGTLAQDLEVDQFYDDVDKRQTKKYTEYLIKIAHQRRQYLEHFNWLALFRTMSKRQFTIGTHHLSRYVDIILLHYEGQPALQADLICSKFSGVSGSQYTKPVLDILTNETTHLTSRIVRYLSNRDRNIPLFNLGSGSMSDFCGMHRWGWEGVVNLLKPYSGQGGLLLDTYLDRTFHWSQSTLKELGILPYRCPWIGFFHHTFKSTCLMNSDRLFNEPLFQVSLLTCRGLFCLSQELQVEALSRLAALKLSIPVCFLYHPTELVVRPFTADFTTSIPIVQVGAWYRNTFSIYAMTTQHPRFGLRNVKMKNYYPPDHIHFTKKDMDLPLESLSPWMYYLFQYLKSHNYLQSILGEMPKNFTLDFDVTTDAVVTSYETGLQHWLFEKIKEVVVLHRLSNQDFDDLLSRCIVFIDFVDVAASNSIVECMARGTPLIVPRLPSIVEYLGEDYPLFFEHLESIDELLTEKNILQCRKHLAERRKIIEPANFVRDFLEKITGL